MVDKLHYNTTLSQTFSPCGNYLVAGNIYGELAVFEYLHNKENSNALSKRGHSQKKIFNFKTESRLFRAPRHRTSNFITYVMVNTIDYGPYIDKVNQSYAVHLNPLTPLCIASVVNPPDGFSSKLKPLYHFTAPRDEQICSLATTDKFLIVGTVGEITGWDWSTIGHNKHPKISWTIQIPVSRDCYEKPDVNSMAVSTDEATGSNLLYTGCGDKKIHVFSLEDGNHVRSFEGHEDYIHSIHKQGWQLVSAGEDGAVRLWDLRQKSLTSLIRPHTNPKVERPSLGKWVGDVCLSDDWLVCGGGPKLSLWHLRTMEVMASFGSIEDSGLHITRFYEDRILAGGTSPYLYHLSLKGDISAQVDSSATTVYSVAIQESPHKVMCIAGSSPNIDVCTNFNYRDQILSFA